jgi:uncharacterized membrane protein HdeD (DUF308 family)
MELHPVATVVLIIAGLVWAISALLSGNAIMALGGVAFVIAGLVTVRHWNRFSRALRR